MGCIIGIIIALVLGVAIAFPVAFLVIFARSRAKKDAKKMLEIGKITDLKKAKSTLDILGKTDKDLEAADLWKKLNELYDKTAK